jgi:trans-aconitate methyltransferase
LLIEKKERKDRMAQILKLYTDLAAWWLLLSTPDDYVEEATFFHQVFSETGQSPPRTLLELGSGSGDNASHLKSHYQITLVDQSPEMLAVSRVLNLECKHLPGDRRTVRLGWLFEAVFIHDAIMYMATETDLRTEMEMVYLHCRPGANPPAA